MPDGNRYVGEFKNDLREGKGFLRLEDGATY
jgi:MORN repeat